MMDVVGNNIANVNTNGFKKSNVIFQDILSQTVSGGSSPTASLGGTNPAQVGLGVQLSNISQNFAQGALQSTGRDLDLSIQGDGFFNLEQDGLQLYGRNGSFYVDANGNLVGAGGGFVQGWTADPTGAIDNTRPGGRIRIPAGEQVAPVITSSVNLGGNLPAESAIGDTSFTSLDVYDGQGSRVELALTFTKTNLNEWTVSATAGDPAAPVGLTDNVLTFDATGRIITPADFEANIPAGAIPGLGDVSLTLAGDNAGEITQLAALGSVAAITQDGSATGQLSGLTVGEDGVITGSYSNGKVKALAQVAIASFANPEGLERLTGTMFKASVNSGLAQLGSASSGGRGTVAPGTLEMSNVDLAEEFTNLIRTQRGFQANSRVITTSDEMLQEIVNLKR
jgi:flagellar hook protein FlgE